MNALVGQRQLITLLLLISVIPTLSACSGQRPLRDVKASGDDAYALGMYDVASAEFGEVVERDPGDWWGQYQYGRTMLKLDRPLEARRALQTASDLRPGNPEIADALAEAMFQLGEQDELFAFLAGRAEATQSVHAYLRWATYAQRMEDPDSAMLAANTAIEIDDGTSAEPYLVAAEIARSVDRPDIEVRRLRQAYAIDDTNEQVIARLRELGEVPGPTIKLPPGR